MSCDGHRVITDNNNKLLITYYGPKTLPRSKYYYHPHLIGEQTESQGGKITAEAGLTPRAAP